MHDTPAFERHIIAPGDIAAHAAQLPRPLVFTNGVFDVLHRGHVTYLAQARAQGASLIDNPVSKAPGFQIGNVFVLAGVPRICQAMFDGI